MKLGSRVGSLALFTFSLLLALGLAESALWLYARSGTPIARALAGWDPFAIKVEPHGGFGFRQRPGAVYQYPKGARATANALGYRGPLVSRTKQPGTFRIVLLGESTTHGGGGHDDQTIDAYLREILAQQAPAPRIEVVNLAFDGYDVYQIWQRLLTDGLPLDPDAIILNAGINDVRNARYAPPLADPDARTLIWEADMRRLRQEQMDGGPSIWTQLKHRLYLARLPGILRAQLAGRNRTQLGRAAPFYWGAADNFERNVLRIAHAVDARRIPLLLSTPPSVLLRLGAPDMPPREYWIRDAATTQVYRDTLAARLVAVARRLAAEGHVVTYVPHELAPAMFLDDCHLTPEGNRRMAEDFAAALAPYLAAARGRSPLPKP